MSFHLEEHQAEAQAEINQKMKVLEALAYRIDYLPEVDRLEAFNKLLDTQVPEVLEVLAQRVEYLPEEAKALLNQKMKELNQ